MKKVEADDFWSAWAKEEEEKWQKDKKREGGGAGRSR